MDREPQRGPRTLRVRPSAFELSRTQLRTVFAAALVFGCSIVAWGAPEAPPPRPRAEVEAVLAQTPPSEAVRALRPLRIVLVADAKDHGPDEHDYPYFQRTWAELLSGGAGEASAPGGTPAGVAVSRAWQWPDAGQWASADVVVAICYLDWSKPRVQELGAFLARGGGFVVVHAATWTRPEPSPQLAELIGVGGFTRWREGPLELELNPEHPICRGLPTKIRLVDEVYWPPTPVPAPGAIEVLAVSWEVDNGGPAVARPLVWTHRRGQGRVFGCVPGHYNWTFDDPLYRLLLLRGIAWSAGESPYRFDLLALERARVAP
jgi:type 1 glutamine amidotransferase